MERLYILLNSQTGENFFKLPVLWKAGRLMHLLEDMNYFLKGLIFLSSVYGKFMKTSFLI